MFPIKRIAAAAALALVAGQASAAISTADLVLVVYDPVTTSTYIRDLGVAATAFTGTAGTNFAATATDAWSTFFNAADGDSWAVIGTSGAGTTQVGYYTNAASVSSTTLISGANLAAMDLKSSQLISGAAALTLVGNSAVSGSANVGSSTDYAILAPTASLGTPSDANIGSSLFILKDVTGRGSIVTSTPYAYSYTLDTTGSLNVSAVPEPGTWALMAAGLLTVGAVARRRSAD